MSAVNTITNRIVIAYGADTVAEMGAGGKAGMIVAMVVMAIALGVQPMFAYLYGAGNTARLRETFRKSGILAVSLGIVLSVVCFIFRFPICGLFLKDEALVASAAHITALGLLGMPLIGVYYLAVNYLQSVGKAAQASVLSVLRQGAVYVPLLLSLHGLFGRRRYFLHTFSHLPPLPRHKERSRLRKAAFARKSRKFPLKNQLNFHILSMTFSRASVILYYRN